jgi:hypothetical protein
MNYADKDLNLQTDERTNSPVAPLDFVVSEPSDLARLRAL